MFTTAPGTTDCGGAGLARPAASPFSGEIDSDTACGAPIANLGLGCGNPVALASLRPGEVVVTKKTIHIPLATGGTLAAEITCPSSSTEKLETPIDLV